MYEKPQQHLHSARVGSGESEHSIYLSLWSVVTRTQGSNTYDNAPRGPTTTESIGWLAVIVVVCLAEPSWTRAVCGTAHESKRVIFSRRVCVA
jgi:hypothetical protein